MLKNNTGGVRMKKASYIVRLVFTVIGLLYILFFTLRGISLITFMLSHYQTDLEKAIIEIVKYSPGYWYDSVINVLNVLILVHGAIGVYYVLSTGFKIKPMTKEKKLFYLHIISSIAVFIFIIFQIKTSGETNARIGIFLALGILLATLGGYHIGKGFFNACITLGIVLSQRSRKVVAILAGIIAGLSILQIAVSFI
jgi:hypothetical protein